VWTTGVWCGKVECVCGKNNKKTEVWLSTEVAKLYAMETTPCTTQLNDPNNSCIDKQG
jgi:hypothetical protein